METANILWVIVLILLTVTINILLNSITMYIANKPLGYQTIYDVVFADNLKLAKFSSSVTILVEIFSRFENIGKETKVALILCSLFFLAFVTICVYTSCVSIVRIICLLNMSFVEERFGDKGIRTALIVFSSIMSIGAFLVVIDKDEMNSGPVYSLLTGEKSTYGNVSHLFHDITKNHA